MRLNGEAMSCRNDPLFRALCLAFIVSLSLVLTGNSSSADQDDHSYLPPWMRNEAAAAADRGEKADPAKPARDDAQPGVAQAQLVKVTEPPSSNFAARVTQAKTKVTSFVSSLFHKSISFVKGE
jgi:hypothetical protein